MDDRRRDALARRAVEWLVREREETGGWMLPAEMIGPGSSFEELWSAFRALVNTREPIPAAPEFLAVQDELLQGLIAEAGITRVEDVAPCPADARVGLWRGDITTIAADAIVNAANSAMTGC